MNAFMNDFLSKKISFFHFLGVFLVLYIHAGLDCGNTYVYGLFQHFTTNVVCRVFQPIYFGLAGYLFFQGIDRFKLFYVTKLKKRFFSLLIPYILFNTVWGGAIPVLHQIPFFNTPWFESAYNYFMNHNVFQSWFYRPALGQLWFIRDLIICVVFTGPLFYLINRAKSLSLVLLLAFCTTGFSLSYSFFSFAVGAFLSIKKIDVEKIERDSLTFIMIFICLVYLFVYGIIVKNFDNSVFLFSWSLFYLLWIGYDKCILFGFANKKKMYELAATYGFFTYLMHDPLMSICKFNLKNFYYGIDLSCFFVYTFLPPVVYLVCIACGTTLKSTIPGFYKIIAGGR